MPPCSCQHSKRPACPTGQRSVSSLGVQDHQAAYQGGLASLPALPEKYHTKNYSRSLRKVTKPERIQAVWHASPAPPRWSPLSWTCTSPGTLEHQRESQRTEVHGDVLQLLLHGCDCLSQPLLVSRMPSCYEALVPDIKKSLLMSTISNPSLLPKIT